MIPANDNTPQPRPQWFDDLLLAHDPYIRNRIASLEKTISKHEDIYQEVVARALERWHKFRSGGNFAGWLYWNIRDVLREETKSSRVASGEPILWPTQPNQEHAADLALALERMPDEVVLSACGHSEVDIGARFGVTGPTVHYRIARAREAMAANDNGKGAA